MHGRKKFDDDDDDNDDHNTTSIPTYLWHQAPFEQLASGREEKRCRWEWRRNWEGLVVVWMNETSLLHHYYYIITHLILFPGVAEVSESYQTVRSRKSLEKGAHGGHIHTHRSALLACTPVGPIKYPYPCLGILCVSFGLCSMHIHNIYSVLSYCIYHQKSYFQTRT